VLARTEAAMNTTFTLSTTGPGLYEFTPQVTDWVRHHSPEEALLTLFIRHTSASLLIQENADPDVQTDLLTWLTRFVPSAHDPAMRWITHTAEGPDDMPAHIKAAHLPTSLQIPVLGGRLVLGTWQGIYLVEHRARPHRREIVALVQ
jgi:secondary thiamine-phosphate synthase enzyme